VAAAGVNGASAPVGGGGEARRGGGITLASRPHRPEPPAVTETPAAPNTLCRAGGAAPPRAPTR
jgi:hypothetical protein